MVIQRLIWSEISEKDKDRLLRRSETDIEEIIPKVQEICYAVKSKGDAALRQFTLDFDKADISGFPISVTEEEFDQAEAELPADLKKAIQRAVENVKKFHITQVPEKMGFSEVTSGIFAGERATPIESVGLYVPRGRGSFPSMLYMLAVPAAIAGVPSISVATPPDSRGKVDPACLYAARICGVTNVYRIGGAQAIAAFAFGTETVEKVVKIEGPGSRFIAAAKRVVSPIINTGMPAGPSESIILADSTAAPYLVAKDLIIEAEHGEDSSALLVTDSSELAAEVTAKLPGLISGLPETRKNFVASVLGNYGGIIQAASMEEACSIVNLFAPEHLQIAVEDDFDVLEKITEAGEILLGQNTPFSLANYATGPNAVLPTGAAAKTYSAVSVRNFIKYSSVIRASAQGRKALTETVKRIAEYEGFAAHALSLDNRDGK
ncbi:MAG: histidinol dehydrogenase [Spirochaetia bacterium]